MYHPRLYGSYEEMGTKYGKLLAKKGFVLPKISSERKAFGLSCIPEIERVYPALLHEIAHFAKAIEVSTEELSAFLFSLVLLEGNTEQPRMSPLS